jgi:cytochrome P450
VRALLRPPGPGGLPVGPPYGFGRADVANQLVEVARKYGDVVRLRLTSGAGYLVNHPDHIKDVLVTHGRDFVKSRGLERAKRLLGEGLLTSEGAFHMRQRRLVQPGFHRDRLKAYGSVMAAFAQRIAQRWQSGTAFDVAPEMMRLTLAIVGETLFGSDIESDAGPVGEALTEIQELLPVSLIPGSEWFDRVPLPSNVRFWRARDRLEEVIYRLIAAHRAGEDRGDLLSMLLAARDAEGGGAGMTDEQVRDECMTLLLAGHETTANALTWTWFLLARHPDVEAKLHAEIDRVLGPRAPAVDDIPALPYAHAVIAESIRLYPPAWVIGRRALRPYEVGGYVLPAHSVVLVSPFAVHRDPRWHRDPLRFTPERFIDDRPAVPKYAYIPFGAGERTCIGEQFAWMEAVLVLATIARRWRLRTTTDREPALLPLVTLRPKGGMPMIAFARSGTSG